MLRALAPFALAVALLAPGLAAAQALDPALRPLAFLLGRWEGQGEVNDTGGRAHGVSTISAEADGHLLLRRDRNEVLDKAGRPTSGFGQVMMIYDEAAQVRGDYVDGEGHVIHYGPAVITPGRAIEFTSLGPGPIFRLRYEAEGTDTLKIWFGLRPPGAPGFQPIAIGEVRRVK